MKSRSRARVSEIDAHIRENYPIKGAEQVAKELGESKDYIQQRAWYLRIRKTSRKGESKTTNKRNVGEKLKKAQAERDLWRRKYHAERVRNANLREKIGGQNVY